MMSFRYNIIWSYVEVYANQKSIGVVNYVNTELEAFAAATKLYNEWLSKN